MVEENRMERGRFAPSPSGRMHLGNLLSALLAWLDVRHAGGVMVLRMEDLDPDRCKEEYAAQVARDLEWLGLDWDEGYGAGGPCGPYRQSERGEIYGEYLKRLEERGLIYPCWCTRAQRLAASAPHPGEARGDGACPCRSLSPLERERRRGEGDRPPALRAAVPDEVVSFQDGNWGDYQENLARDCGDFLVRRSDGVCAYQLAVTVDDGLMGITRVVRGRDLLSSTPRQIWLHRALGFPPPRYFHTPLLLAPDGRRLSKRERDLDMGALRERFTPEELTGRLAALAGLQETPRPVAARELVKGFSWEKVQKKDSFPPPDWFGYN
jgi:glutamyl-tRNA synthetase